MAGTLEWGDFFAAAGLQLCNFATGADRDEFAEAKMADRAYPEPGQYEDIHMPKTLRRTVVVFAKYCLDVRISLVDVVAGNRFHGLHVPSVYRVDVQN